MLRWKPATWEKVMGPTRRSLLGSGIVGLAALATRSYAANKYDPGASDTEIKIGNIMPYSGPASAWGVVGRTEAAYFDKINAEGGINGRRITFISYDDGYSPPKTVEQARKLVESDGVLLIFSSLGTPTNTAIQKYMNARKVPQLFVSTGAAKWNDPKHFPWTMGLQASYELEGQIYARYLLANRPNGKIGVLYQNDDYGKDYVKGLKDGLNGRMPVVAVLPYETQDSTVDSQIVSLKASGADVLYNVSSPKFAAQAIRKVAEVGWTPVHLLNSVSASIGAVLKPAGLENAKGILSAASVKDQTDPVWSGDAGYKAWASFLDKYYPAADRTNSYVVGGYNAAQALAHVLRQCGDDLTRENVMRQAANLKDLQLDMLLPGITVNTGPNDFAPIKQMQMRRFTGEHWELFGPVITAEVGGT
jgi:branched-chain amino acid transport system substrate-binding protein